MAIKLVNLYYTTNWIGVKRRGKNKLIYSKALLLVNRLLGTHINIEQCQQQLVMA